MVFLGGLLGSSHCVGMCGGFALSLGAGAANLRSNLARQLLYSLGRIFTYAAGGAAVGYGGWRIARDLPPLVHAQAWLCLAAGVLLMVQGLSAAGWLMWRRTKSRRSGCLAAGLFAQYLRAPGWTNVFLAGVLNGLLPCGLVYAFLALATSRGTMLAGLVQMAVFGLGTVPIMVLSGCGGSLLSFAGRQRLLRLAACCVVLTGMLTIARGVAFLRADSAAACPACEQMR